MHYIGLIARYARQSSRQKKMIEHLTEKLNRVEADVMDQRLDNESLQISLDHAIALLERATAEVNARNAR